MSYIKIEGYKSIKKTVLPLNPVNILIGSNGSGKSNFISFFEMVHCIYENRLTEFIALNGGTERFLHKGHKQTSMIKGEVSHEGSVYEFELREGDGRFIIAYESIGKQSGVDGSEVDF